MKRPRGTGRIFVKHGAWYGSWRAPSGARLTRKVGPVRRPGTRDGLTRPQAEALLRDLIAQVVVPAPGRRISVQQGGERLLTRLEAKGSAKSHRETVESHLRVHLVPFFGASPLDRIGEADIERLMAVLHRRGRAPKTIRNVLSTLHSIFELAIRQKIVAINPCKLVEKPEIPDYDDLNFLMPDEFEALLLAVPQDDWGAVERPLYLMAALTGMRQGELLGVRWRDLDWLAQKIRVRRNYVRGEFRERKKSRRSSRTLPMEQMRLAGELERLRRQSAFRDDDDLVFAHPHTGRPLDRSKLLKRFKAALRIAGVRDIRFHDLRHTFGTRLAAAGVPLRTIQAWYGHRDSTTTDRYVHYQPGEREAEIISRAFGFHPIVPPPQ